MLCAREMRGNNSKANALMRRAFKACKRALSSKGLSKPISTAPSGMALISSTVGGVTRKINCAAS